MNRTKKKSKVTTGHKVTIGALGVLGVVAGWNVVGRAEQAAAVKTVAPVATPDLATAPVAPLATPWPTIPPLAEHPRLDARPLPTLAVVIAPDAAVVPGAASDGVTVANITAPNLMPLPTLAPLPTMPEYVAPPPPPPAPPAQVAAAPPPPADSGGNGGGNTSSGS